MSPPALPAGIIDGHTHIASSRFIPRPFLEGIAENMAVQSNLTSVPLTRTRIMERMLGIYGDHDGEVQIRQMEALGVEKSVVLIPDFSFAMPGAGPTIAEIYAAHAAILRRHPARFCMFGGVDPRWGADALRLFVQGIELFGFRGLKLYPPCGYRADDPALTPFYEVCQAYRLPVLVHIGPTSPALSFAEAHPMTIDAPARRFAEVPFILAHGGVNYVEECVQLCGYRPNVYLDLSGAQSLVQAGAATGSLARVLAGGIGHKIIFGTDWPINQHVRMNRALLDVVAGLGGRVAGLIAGGNMRRLLDAVTVPGARVRGPAEASA